MADIYGAVGSLISAGASFGLAAYNNEMQKRQTREDREQNYVYNEMSANNADRRTRGLYQSFYSPEALLKQYQDAGLSPSMMFGGTPGQGGMSGAQGSGTQGLQTPYMPVSLLEAAQVANIIAQTDKTKAETKSVNEDIDLKEIQKQMDTMAKNLFQTDYDIITAYFYDPSTGEPTESLTDIAMNSKSYENFVKEVRSRDMTDSLRGEINTERGQNTLRQIYHATNELGRDIAVFKQEKTTAAFQQQIIDWLKKENYAEWNAKEIVSSLKTQIDTNNLTQQQKEAWDNLLKGLEVIGGKPFKEANIVMYMLLQTMVSTAAQGIKVVNSMP